MASPLGNEAHQKGRSHVDEDKSWRAVISQVTWMVCRKFQFQCFNYLDAAGKGTLDVSKAERCTPATAFLVSDHLAQLIITDGMAREDRQMPAVGFGNAVWRLHVTVFSPYEEWASHQRLEPFSRRDVADRLMTSDNQAILAGLLDLCVFFCLWTEAANLRHMPESIWFFYWSMQHSGHFDQLKKQVDSGDRQGYGDHIIQQALPGNPEFLNLQLRRVELRNQYLDTIHQERAQYGTWVPFNQDKHSNPIPKFDTLTLATPDFRDPNVRWDALNPQGLSPFDRAILWELVLFGDGGAFVDRIVTPVFRALAYEVGTKGGKGVEPAMRITYDDANESFVVPQNIARIVKEIGGSLNEASKLFMKLWMLGESSDGWNVSIASAWYTGKNAITGGSSRPWLLKTFQERRTWFATYLAYFRIFAFHIIWFHVLLGLSFAQEDEFESRWWVGLSSAVLTHAFLEFVYHAALIYTRMSIPTPPAGRSDVRQQVIYNNSWFGALFALCCCCLPRRLRGGVGLEGKRDLTGKEQKERALNKLWHVGHVSSVAGGVNSVFRIFLPTLAWLLAFAALGFLFIAQFSWFPWPDEDADDASPDDEPLRIGDKAPAEFFKDLWPAVAGIYGGIAIAMWGPITQRDGYVVTPSSVVQWLKALWGGVSTKSRSFLGGEFVTSVAPRVGWFQLLRNILFWCIVIIAKFAIDYFLILRQLPEPIRGLLRQDWLGTCGDDLVISDTSIPCVENMLLVGALCIPVFLVTLFDTGILYQVGVFAYGCTHGLTKLGLGQVVTWNDLVKQFELGVTRFNKKILSEQAKRVWTDPRCIQRYYEYAFQGTGSQATDKALPELSQLNDEQCKEYQKWTPFADIWDSIVLDLRLSDFISNDEEANLKFNAVHFLRKHGLKPHVIPICFFAGKIQRALDDGTVDSISGVVLREAYHLFLALIAEVGLLQPSLQMELWRLTLVNQPQNYYHNAVRRKMVQGIRDIISLLSSFKKGANQTELKAKLVTAFTGLIEDTLIELEYARKLSYDIAAVETQILALQNVLHGVHGPAERPSIVREGATGNLAIAEQSVLDRTLQALSDSTNQEVQAMVVPVQEIRTLLLVLNRAIVLTDQEAEPNNEEASRVLKFFMSTLFNNTLKTPLKLNELRSLTTLVPHYSEGVIYPLDTDEVKSLTGTDAKRGDLGDILVDLMPGLDVSTIDFLRIQFRDEWDNFVQRMVAKYKVETTDPEAITERDFRQSEGGMFSEYEGARMDLMLWASERGQMLSRTVKGMLMYGNALAQLEFVETVDDRGGTLYSVVEQKFRHIVSSQVYGAKKQSKKPADKWLAMSIDFLMKRYPALRIAYIDMAKSLEHGGKGTPMSVLLRWSTSADAVEEVYRVRLPDQVEDGRGVILGEGKPENQNHAMIFCFGECLQTVDMNQENRHAEALKMRNLLEEFSPRHIQYAEGPKRVGDYRNGIKAHQRKSPIVALVGFREWIFSGKAGALGKFAAGAEFAFGTIVQRTMAEPNGCRFHYGHPDVWNKLFTMTRGGVSKATRAFHISEDVFGGYNAIFRGAIIKYREYMSVGKARDVGFSQINGFEAKVAGGNGEQSISRDVHRLGSRLGWFRLMSWYHSGIGFFINSALTMSSVYLAVWLIFLFALSDSLTVRNGSGERATGLNDDVVIISTINTVQLFQLGLLSVIPYWGELCLETGFLEGSLSILQQMGAGALLFFIFRQQTSAYYFTQIVYYGGAKYIATGRGFDLVHTSFVKTFTSFGRSHMYFGFQLALMATMLAFLDLDNYALSTWGTWLVAVSLTFSPFWFNPVTFRLQTVLDDFRAWRQWMFGSTDTSTKQSWIVFHRSDLEKARNIEGKQTDHGWNRVSGVLMQLFNVLILVALGERIVRADYETVIVDDETGATADVEVDGSVRRKVIGVVVYELALVVLVLMIAVARAVRTRGANVRRYISVAAGIALAVLFALYLAYVGRNASAGFRDIVLITFANITALIIIVQLALYLAPFQRWSVLIVDAGYYAADTGISLALFVMLFVLSIVPIVDSLQALFLFSSELLMESRRGQQLRLFDAKRGALQAKQGSGVPEVGAASERPAAALGMQPQDGVNIRTNPAAAQSLQRMGRRQSQERALLPTSVYGTFSAQTTAANSGRLMGAGRRRSQITAAGGRVDIPEEYHPRI